MAQPYDVPLRMQPTPSQDCKVYMAERCKENSRSSKLDGLLRRVPAQDFSLIPAQSAGWHHLRRSFFASDDVIWNLAGLSWLPSRKHRGVVAPKSYRPERLTGVLCSMSF